MTDPPPAPQDVGPEKKKAKRVEKPLPPFLEALDTLTLHEYTITTEMKKIKTNEGQEEEVEVACIIAKGDNKTHVDKDLSVHQLRKLVRRLGITKASLNKTELRYHLLKTKNEIGIITRQLEKIPSTHCRLINVLFHRDFIDEFMAFNDGRSRAVQETGSGSQYQRFWKLVVDAVNGADCSPQKLKECTDLEKKSEDDSEEEYSEEDSQVEKRINPDQYGKLEIRDDNKDDRNLTYNNHVLDAGLAGLDPSLKNTNKLTPNEANNILKTLLQVRKHMETAMNASGSHSSDPWDFAKAGIARARSGGKISQFTAFYFYSKSNTVQNFETTFTSALAPCFAIDSLPAAKNDGKSSRASSRAPSPISCTTTPTNGTTDSHMTSAIGDLKNAIIGNAMKREERMGKAALLNEFSILTAALKDQDSDEMKQRMKKRIAELATILGL